MEVITESSEHHYLSLLERIKEDPKNWAALYFGLSSDLDQKDLIKAPAAIREKIGTARQKAEDFMNALAGKAGDLSEAYLYLFTDHDVMLVVRHEDQRESEFTQKLFGEVTKGLSVDFCDYATLEDELFNYQKLAERKLITAKRFESYDIMADKNKVANIALRRKRRGHPLVMVVEDDRFTASYAANILNRDYDLVLCRTGEEAIADYIECAPDMVFLDIHLPGLTGHQTLHCIQAVDPKAYVWMLSVDTVRTNIVQATETGAYGFLKKPFSKERLLRTVKKSPYVKDYNKGEPGGETLLH